MAELWSEKRGWIVAAFLLVFTPLASWILRIVGVLFSIIGFFLSLVNALGLFVVIVIAAIVIWRRLES